MGSSIPPSTSKMKFMDILYTLIITYIPTVHSKIQTP